MHFEILVEDQSGKVALDILVSKIIGDDHTCDVKSYKGVGRIPTKMNASADASKRILRPVKFAENEEGIILKFKHKT